MTNLASEPESLLNRSNPSCGGWLVNTDGRELPLRSAAVQAEGRGGIARVTLKQVFANPHTDTLQVSYTMPLPADGAVAGYEFRIGERRVIGRVENREQAREQFEEALLKGHTAGLVDQERTNLFTQQLGNVPPGTEVEVELTVDQRLGWLDEGMWEWRFPLVAAPRYLGDAGRVPDPSRVSIDFEKHGSGVKTSLDFTIRDFLIEGRAPESPSHPLAVSTERGATKVTFSEERGAALDRDIVVRWAIPRPVTGLSIQTARPGEDNPLGSHAYGLLTIVPPEAPAETLARDLIILLDTSGSMHGWPLDQSKRVIGALIDSLGDEDRLEMIAFNSTRQHWCPGPIAATTDNRRAAHRWLAGQEADGGTEMRDAVVDALKPLRPGAQRQVVLVTDGHIGFETEVIGALRSRLPEGSRLHTVGVGQSVNRALLKPAARAGRGQEILIGLGEDPERGVARIVAATRKPIVTELQLGGDALDRYAPARLPDLMAGAPVLAAVRLKPAGGELTLRGQTASGRWEQRITVQSIAPGQGAATVTALYAREAVEDLELDIAGGGNRGEIDTTIERLGLAFQIATRVTSWIAISEEPTVDPRRPIKYQTMPQELPYGMSVEGMGLMGGMMMGREGVNALCLAMSDAPASSSAMISRPSRILGISRLSDFFRGKRHEKQIDTEDALPLRGHKPAGADEKVTGPSFIGHWMGAFSGGTQVVEFAVVVARLIWRPADSATIELRDGSRRVVPVRDGSTTLPGPITPRGLVRLGLELEAQLRDQVVAVTIETDGTEIRIEF